MSFWSRHETLGCILMLAIATALCFVLGRDKNQDPNDYVYYQCEYCGVEYKGTPKYFDEDEFPLCSDCYIKLLEDELEEDD